LGFLLVQPVLFFGAIALFDSMLLDTQPYPRPCQEGDQLTQDGMCHVDEGTFSVLAVTIPAFVVYLIVNALLLHLHWRQSKRPAS
jgi:hypothetical protein